MAREGTYSAVSCMAIRLFRYLLHKQFTIVYLLSDVLNKQASKLKSKQRTCETYLLNGKISIFSRKYRYYVRVFVIFLHYKCQFCHKLHRLLVGDDIVSFPIVYFPHCDVNGALIINPFNLEYQII
jgi:hypothetical protein